MARKLPFSLKMADGESVRTIEDLREHFDLAAVLGYYENGKLSEWLTDRYYDAEADKVRALDKYSVDLNKNLCEILGVPYSENEVGQLDISDIARNNEHREHLKQFTADDAILAVSDRVAFTQNELEDLLDKGVKEIYLCEDRESFTVPVNVGSITYIGVNNPTVQFKGEIVEPDIVFRGLELNIGNYVDNSIFFSSFDQTPELGVKLLQLAAEKEYAEVQYMLGECYKRGFGIEKSMQEAVIWYRKAAEQGHAGAQYELGKCYRYGIGVHGNTEEAVKWYQKAANQGNVEARYELGKRYVSGESVKIKAGAAGKIFKIEAKVGQAVKAGDAVVIFEAMKMEIPVVAPQDGIVASIDVAVGDAVEAGALLATLYCDHGESVKIEADVEGKVFQIGAKVGQTLESDDDVAFFDEDELEELDELD